jgi:2-polyprenyl-3-methyl-5-hydroxy-6-metoxy-1,4-benzoquinol methylase
MDKKQIINYFKAQAINGEWARLYDLENPISYSFIQRFIKTVNLMKPIQGNILDMGCGTGIMVSIAKENKAKYVGFDAAVEMIDACKKQFKTEIENGLASFFDTDSKDFKSDIKFDYAIGMGYLEYFTQPQECLEEAKRNLAPNGKLILSFPHKNSLDNFSLLILSPFRKILTLLTGRSTTQPPRKYWSTAEARALFENNGYEVKNLVFYNTSFFHYPFTKIMPRFSNFMASKIENTWLNKIPFLSTGFIIAAVPK